MKVDAQIMYGTLDEVPHLVQAAEDWGLDAVWFSEAAHDPFLAAALAAQSTSRIAIGTAIALAFTRSPTLLAYLGWDLAALSRGRFMLGLGTQVRAHIVRRFGMPWAPPAPRLRTTVQAVHAVWDAWRSGTPLNFRGPGTTLTLMTPFFTPPPQPHAIPILTAGVNPPLCRVAGEVADGFHVHPFHTPAYLREVVLPAIARGREKAQRTLGPFEIVVSAITVIEGTPVSAEVAKRTLAFYASTPSYRGVLAHHGWEDLGQRLSVLASRGRWAEMNTLISDDVLHAFAVVASPDEFGSKLRERYRGLADRIGLYEPLAPNQAALYRSLIAAVRT
ncbi:MAG TPA: TIGR03617 family F420-dependent LLM class oxidoreductase [bacterium]|nr:TIGR03617 family F420-dependent LLM class oxidoreductase [bacterium]